ncbi:MAG: hypothetical protein PF505_13645, partial [Vallitaleaceae bacterium]|nr:hypothetical protein [Vallitaleaceae bacterium]
MVAEADGSHPIGIFIGEWEYTALDAMWSPSGNYIAFHGIGEMTGYGEGMGGTSYVDRKGLKFGGMEDGNSASGNPWGYIDDIEVFVVNPKDDWDGIGIRIIDPSRDEFSFTDDDYTKSWPSISPDGKFMALVESDTRDPYDYGKLYLNNLETGINKKLTDNGALPVFSPDSKYMAYNVLSGSMRKIKIKSLNDSDYNILVDTGANIYQPVFNSDSSKLYFNEKNNTNGGIILKYYDIVHEQIYTVGASKGVSGKADLLTITTDMLVNEDIVYLTEGSETTLSLQLVKMPEQEVTVKAVVISSAVEINQDELIFDSSNWNIDQNFLVSAVDDDDEDNGNRIYEIRFIISSEDDDYKNGSSISSQVYITDNDGLDTIAPEWEEESYINLESYGNTQLKATWPKGKDNVGVTSYRVILEDGEQKEIYNDVVTEQVFISETLLPTVTYTVKVYALDAMHNSSGELSAFYTPEDDANPYFNSEDIISINYLSGHEVEIVWDEAHDDTVINRYNVYLDDVLIGSTSERIYTKTGLDSDTRYTISVRPVDSSDNIGTRIGMTFTTLNEDDFEQGLGYYDGTYLYGAIHPTYNQWNGSSRFSEPTSLGLSFVLEDYNETSPVIDVEGNIYTTNAAKQLSKLDKNGNLLWVNESAVVQGEITLQLNHLYFVDSGGGVSICSYSTGALVSRYITADYIVEEIMGIDRDNNLILKVFQNENIDCILFVSVDFEASPQFNLIRRIPVLAEIDNYVLGDDGWIYFIDNSNNFLGYDLFSPNDTYHYQDGYYKGSSIDNKMIEEPYSNLNISKMLSGTNANHDLFLYQKNREYGSRRFISAFDTEGVFSEGSDVYEIKWQTEINGSLTSTQVTQTDDGKLIASGYSGVDVGYIVCIDTTNGDFLWDISLDGSNFNNKRALVDKNENIYIVDDGGKLFKLNMDGEVIAEIDVAIDDDETFSMPIIGSNAMYLTHNGLIKLSDQGIGEFSVAEYIKVLELEEEETALIPVKLEGNDSGVRYIHYKTEDIEDIGYDAAQADGIWDTYDYTSAEGYLRFDEGETVKYVEITIHDDTFNESYEPFKLIIDEPLGGANLKENESTMIIGIRDDDYQNPLGFAFTSKTVDEADGSVVLTVDRDEDGFLKACSVDYRIESDGTPEEDGYIDQHGSLEFEKGELEKSITVVLVNDDVYVPGRSFTVVLEDPRLVDVDAGFERMTI